jgi:hypothetical protein
MNSQSRTALALLAALLAAVLALGGCGGSTPPSPAPVRDSQPTSAALPAPSAASPTLAAAPVGIHRTVADVRADLAVSRNLDYLHQLKGVACESCHGPLPEANAPVLPDTERCLSCHGGKYEAVAAKTAFLGTKNPHDAHTGPLDCTECHHVHRPSASVCNECHSF